VDVFQFKWNRLSEGFDRDETLAGRKAAIEEFLQTIATSLWSGNLAAIDRGLIVNRLSKIVGLDSKEINAELNKRIGRAAKTASYGVANQKVRSFDLGDGLFSTAQREVLEVLLNKPELFETVKQKITVEDFDVPALRQTASILFEALNANPETRLAEIIARTESLEASSLLVELSQLGEAKGNFESRLAGALNAISRHHAQSRKSEIKTTDGRQFLQQVLENTGKQNPHSTGMI
ncbi:MAG: hypothetical protein JW947_02510, partial [Sedimentisphaerales bacterium]|nr:hypothetical protein [Sedimentisphaerales bacterium]